MSRISKLNEGGGSTGMGWRISARWRVGSKRQRNWSPGKRGGSPKRLSMGVGGTWAISYL